MRAECDGLKARIAELESSQGPMSPAGALAGESSITQPVASDSSAVGPPYRALKTAFSVGELRTFDMSPLPSPERTSFREIGESYARAVRGGAKHAVLPPKPQPFLGMG
jgi:hypothetical protein